MRGSLKRLFALLLILFCMNLYLPRFGFTQVPAAQINLISSVESVSTPEADITESGSNFKWWMVALGAVLIGVLAAMAGGGKGGSNPDPNPTGSVSVTW